MADAALPLEPCAQCHGRSFIRVLGLRERAAGRWLRIIPDLQDHRHAVGRVAVGAIDGQPVGWYEVLLCRGCGVTSWTARDAERVIAAPLDRTTERCASCRADTLHAHVEPVELACGVRGTPGGVRAGAPIADGISAAMRVLICGVCSTTRWRVMDLDRAKPGYWNHLHDAPGDCAHCDSTSGARLEPVREPCAGMVLFRPKLPIALKKGIVADVDARGHFRIRVCRGCGETTWTGLDLKTVKNDAAADVSIVSAGAQSATDGPYR